VLPEYRRRGVAAKLFAELRERAVEQGVECLYLHTHGFLEGAREFWEGVGFGVREVESDEVWRTVHMDLDLELGVECVGGGKDGV
jgi:GNAT superfamily N-acetyltransferase